MLTEKRRLPTFILFCKYSTKCWEVLFKEFMSWVFGADFRENVRTLSKGFSLNKEATLLWENKVKATLAEIWSERNQIVFYDKSMGCFDRFEIAHRNASRCILSNLFGSYSIQDINKIEEAFIFFLSWFCCYFSVFKSLFLLLLTFHCTKLLTSHDLVKIHYHGLVLSFIFPVYFCSSTKDEITKGVSTSDVRVRMLIPSIFDSSCITLLYPELVSPFHF